MTDEARRMLEEMTEDADRQVRMSARIDREIALLKVIQPEMCGITEADLDRIAEVLEG